MALTGQQTWGGVYGSDAFTLAGGADRPTVIFPTSTQEVVEAVRRLAAEGTPVVCRGSGTGLAGGAAVLERGVVVCTSRMTRILSVDASARVAQVESGVRNSALSAHLAADPKTRWLHFAPDPSSARAATIGGNAATNAGGVHTLKDFTTTNHVLGLEMVLPDGTVLTTGYGAGGSGGARPFELTGLVCGSEGTLGLITSLWVRLTPAPKHFRTAVAGFADSAAACQAVSAVIGSGLLPSALEMMDGVMVEVIREHGNIDLPAAAALLLLELDGPPDLTALDMEEARQLLAAEGMTTWEASDDPAVRSRLWKARKNAFGAIGRVSRSYCTQDACVPRSKLAEVLEFIGQTGRRYGLTIPNVFHAGDGNIHPIFLFDDRDEQQVSRVLQAAADVLTFCLSVGGTLSGEHGIGVEKVGLMGRQFDGTTLAAFGEVKAAFDPGSVFNRGKLLPDGRVKIVLHGPGRQVPQ